jgi:hypothetical protein
LFYFFFFYSLYLFRMKRKREQKKKNKCSPQRSSPLPPIFVSPFPLSHIYIWRLGRGEETGGRRRAKQLRCLSSTR